MHLFLSDFDYIDCDGEESANNSQSGYGALLSKSCNNLPHSSSVDNRCSLINYVNNRTLFAYSEAMKPALPLPSIEPPGPPHNSREDSIVTPTIIIDNGDASLSSLTSSSGLFISSRSQHRYSQVSQHSDIQWGDLIDLYCEKLLCSQEPLTYREPDCRQNRNLSLPISQNVNSSSSLVSLHDRRISDTYFECPGNALLSNLPQFHDISQETLKIEDDDETMPDTDEAALERDSGDQIIAVASNSVPIEEPTPSNSRPDPYESSQSCPSTCAPEPVAPAALPSPHQSMLESSKRLATRLYQLQGFQPQDVPVHLCRRNEFSENVTKEYSRMFLFHSHTLDVALRQWVRRCPFLGELVERERLLQIFVHRFCECNPFVFNERDACVTLACAILLLNTDLHGNHTKSRLSQEEFVSKLLHSNHGRDYSTEQLSHIYQRIAQDPIFTPNSHMLAGMFDVPAKSSVPFPVVQIARVPMAYNPLTDIPSAQSPKDFLHGFLLRKQIKERAGRRAPLGKRGWKLFFVRLCGLELQFYRSCGKRSCSALSSWGSGGRGFCAGKPGSGLPVAPSPVPLPLPSVSIPAGMTLTGVTRIDHCTLQRAHSYVKRPHVFMLRTRHRDEYLFQVGSEKEVSVWIEMINFVSALLAVPPTYLEDAPSDVAASTSGYTWLNIVQQVEAYQRFLQDHQTKDDLQADTTEDKAEELQLKLQRYQHYLLLLEDEVRALREYFANQSHQMRDMSYAEGANGSPPSLASNGSNAPSHPPSNKPGVPISSNQQVSNGNADRNGSRGVSPSRVKTGMHRLPPIPDHTGVEGEDEDNSTHKQRQSHSVQRQS